MTARERLAKLFDDNSFVEPINSLNIVVLTSVKTKRITRRRCSNWLWVLSTVVLVYAFAQDFTVEGGSLGEMHAAKIVKVQRLAMKMGALSLVSMIPAGLVFRSCRCSCWLR